MKNKILILVLILITLIGSLYGCYGSKDTDPIQIIMTYDKSEYSKDDDIKLNIHFDFLDQKSKEVKLLIKTDEIIKIKGKKEYNYSDANKITDRKISVKLCKPFETNSYGEIRAHLYTYDASGTELYYRSTAIYYHISDVGIRIGKSGVYELRVKHLDNLLKAEKINKLQHKNLLEKLSRENHEITITDGGGK